MVYRSSLPLLLLSALVGLTFAVSIEDEFYRNIRGQSTYAGLDDSREQTRGDAEASKPPNEAPKERDSWKKLSMDMVAYLKLLSQSGAGLERKLKELAEKVESDLHAGHKESYTLNYAKQLLQEQRAVIEALRADALGETNAKRAPLFEDVLQKTEQFVKPVKSTVTKSTEQVDSELASEHENLIVALKNLQNLKF